MRSRSGLSLALGLLGALVGPAAAPSGAAPLKVSAAKPAVAADGYEIELTTAAGGKSVKMRVDSLHLDFQIPADSIRMIFGPASLIAVDARQRTIIEYGYAELIAARGNQNRLMEDLRQSYARDLSMMTNEQRGTFEDLLGARLPSTLALFQVDPRPPYGYRETRDTARVAGFEVRKVEWFRPNKPADEIWVCEALTPRPLRELGRTMRRMMPSDHYGDRNQDRHSLLDEVMTLGVVLRTVDSTVTGSGGPRVRLASRVERKRLPGDAFEAPPGFARRPVDPSYWGPAPGKPQAP